MRFAWQRENSPSKVPAQASLSSRIVYAAYNILYWVPIVLPFTRAMDYRTGFVVLFVVLIFRSAANLYRNNFLQLEQAETFPFRSP
jgi:hypothetical protein